MRKRKESAGNGVGCGAHLALATGELDVHEAAGVREPLLGAALGDLLLLLLLDLRAVVSGIPVSIDVSMAWCVPRNSSNKRGYSSSMAINGTISDSSGERWERSGRDVRLGLDLAGTGEGAVNLCGGEKSAIFASGVLFSGIFFSDMEGQRDRKAVPCPFLRLMSIMDLTVDGRCFTRCAKCRCWVEVLVDFPHGQGMGRRGFFGGLVLCGRQPRSREKLANHPTCLILRDTTDSSLKS